MEALSSSDQREGRRGVRPTTSSQAVSLLKAMIRDGQLPGGSRLDQIRLAEQLGVSRTPIREAFAVLEAEGWIVRTSAGSVSVLGRDHRDLRDQLDLTALVYSAVLVRVTGAGIADRRELTVLAEAARARSLRSQPALFTSINGRFLARCVDIARSSRLAQACRLVSSGHFEGYFAQQPVAIRVQQRGLGFIETAIRRSDAEGARVAMRELCEAHLRLMIGG